MTFSSFLLLFVSFDDILNYAHLKFCFFIYLSVLDLVGFDWLLACLLFV